MGNPLIRQLTRALTPIGIVFTAFIASAQLQPSGPEVPRAIYLPCYTNDVPEGFGYLAILKGSLYEQATNAAPAPVLPSGPTPFPPIIGGFDGMPPAGYSFSNVVLTAPTSQPWRLIPTATGGFGTATGFPNEEAMATNMPAGTWIASYQVLSANSPGFQGFFFFEVTTNEPPVPQLTNLTAAQSIDASAPLLLEWEPWTGAQTNDRVVLHLVDSNGETVFSAATDCTGEVPLPHDARSIEVPAGRLRAGTTYTGFLGFAGSIMRTQDDRSRQVLLGLCVRVTRFTVRTTGTAPADSADLLNFRISGTNLLMQVRGEPRTAYRIQSTTNFLDWETLTVVSLPISGVLNISVPRPTDGIPRFYRATDDSGPVPGEQPRLTLERFTDQALALQIFGPPGAVVRVDFSTNLLSWQPMRPQPYVLPSRNGASVRITLAGFTNSPPQFFRAVSQ